MLGSLYQIYFFKCCKILLKSLFGHSANNAIRLKHEEEENALYFSQILMSINEVSRNIVLDMKENIFYCWTSQHQRKKGIDILGLCFIINKRLT